MSTSETLPTDDIYRGYKIIKAPRHGEGEFNFFKLPFTGDYQEADSPEHARELIDAIEWIPEPPSSPLSISGDKHKLEVLLFSLRDQKEALEKICVSHPGLQSEIKNYYNITEEWMKVVAQAMKDIDFETEYHKNKY